MIDFRRYPLLTAMVTPFDSSGAIDIPATGRIVEHLLATGSDGIVVAGTTGESPTLSDAEKLELFRLVRRTAGPNAAVIAGTGSNNTAASIELSLKAADCGVDGLLLVAPPYNRPSQPGLNAHFTAIAAAVPQLPCMLYNVPSRTSVNIEAATTLRLGREVPNVTAVKEASGSIAQCSEILAGAAEGFALFSGDDILTLPLLALGGSGIVSVTSHLVGREIKEMIEAYRSGSPTEAAAHHARMLPIIKACFQPTTPNPVPLKAALELMGICSARTRLPLVEATDAERAIVAHALAATGLA